MSTEIKKYKKTKFACYFTYLVMASVFSFPPLLFATFREMYGISYTLLGTLILINFCTQLTVDLIFSFFTRFFNVHKTLRLMPLITALGLSVYAIVPTLFPNYAYIGLVIGTFIFSVAAGLCEVLVSPTIAALPSDNPERDMSNLHSLYAYGFVSVVLISTVLLKIFGNHNWMYLAFLWAFLPIIASVLLTLSPLPDMNMEQTEQNSEKSKFRTKIIGMCLLCIFLGAASENVMSGWISVYMEKALGIPKIWGDIAGMSAFAIVLGLTRTAYAKYGKNISNVLLLGMLGSLICYLVIAFSSNTVISIIACVSVGLCSSMLWPGTLILMEEKLPAVGVAAYALMAAGGDSGSSVAPQLLGGIIDAVKATDWAVTVGNSLSLTPEQVGMKVGMLIITLFPLIGVILLIYMKNFFKKNKI